MKINKPFLQILSLVFGIALVAGCQSSANSNKINSATATGGGGATPTEAYKNLYAAVKSKNTEAIKQNVSATTQEFAASVAQMQKKTIEDMYKNGLTETTITESLPPMRNERVKNDMGAVEVRNPRGEWEDLPFVLENGSWKLAIGDIFKGTYQKPAPSIAETETNKNVPQIMPAPNSMTNMNNSSKSNPTAPTAPTDSQPDDSNLKPNKNK